MKTERFHDHADRYKYDTGMCSLANGFAQVDTGQDAWYFGTWANPETLQIVCYCEGDVTIQTADNALDFAVELNRIKQWNEENGHGFKGIDPGFDEKLKARFAEVGVADLLH